MSQWVINITVYYNFVKFSLSFWSGTDAWPILKQSVLIVLSRMCSDTTLFNLASQHNIYPAGLQNWKKECSVNYYHSTFLSCAITTDTTDTFCSRENLHYWCETVSVRTFSVACSLTRRIFGCENVFCVFRKRYAFKIAQNCSHPIWVLTLLLASG